AGPAPLHAFDRPAHDRLEAVDRGGDVELLGRGIAWLVGGLVMGAHPDPIVRLALEIESLERVVDEGQVTQPRAANAQLRDRATVRLDPDWRNAATTSDIVGPRAGGIDDDACRQLLRVRLDRPSIARPPRGGELGRAPDRSADATEMREAGVVKTRDIDICAARIPDSVIPTRPQPGDSFLQPFPLKLGERRVA